MCLFAGVQCLRPTFTSSSARPSWSITFSSFCCLEGKCSASASFHKQKRVLCAGEEVCQVRQRTITATQFNFTITFRTVLSSRTQDVKHQYWDHSSNHPRFESNLNSHLDCDSKCQHKISRWFCLGVVTLVSYKLPIMAQITQNDRVIAKFLNFYKVAMT